MPREFCSLLRFSGKEAVGWGRPAAKVWQARRLADCVQPVAKARRQQSVALLASERLCHARNASTHYNLGSRAQHAHTGRQLLECRAKRRPVTRAHARQPPRGCQHIP
jgi:hypothetical protein